MKPRHRLSLLALIASMAAALSTTDTLHFYAYGLIAIVAAYVFAWR